ISGNEKSQTGSFNQVILFGFKRIKKGFQLFVFNTFTLIFYGDIQEIILRIGAQGNPAFGNGKFDGVYQEVAHHFGEFGFITQDDLRQLVMEFRYNTHLFAVSRVLVYLGKIDQELFNIERLVVDIIDLVGFYARHIQHVGYLLHGGVASGIQVFCQRSQRCVFFHVIIQQQGLANLMYSIQGAFQLMIGDPDKKVFGDIGRFQLCCLASDVIQKVLVLLLVKPDHEDVQYDEPRACAKAQQILLCVGSQQSGYKRVCIIELAYQNGKQGDSDPRNTVFIFIKEQEGGAEQEDGCQPHFYDSSQYAAVVDERSVDGKNNAVRGGNMLFPFVQPYHVQEGNGFQCSGDQYLQFTCEEIKYQAEYANQVKGNKAE